MSGYKASKIKNEEIDEMIANNALRFYEYYNEQLDSLISGVIANQTTYREPTHAQKNIMARTFDKHVMHIAYTKQSIHEVFEFIVSLVPFNNESIDTTITIASTNTKTNTSTNINTSTGTGISTSTSTSTNTNGDSDSSASIREVVGDIIDEFEGENINRREDVFNLFTIRRINLVLGQMVNYSYIIHSMDSMSIDSIEKLASHENLFITLLKLIDRYKLRVMAQTLESSIILVHNSMSQIINSMAPHKTPDGRMVSGIEYPPRIFVVYNWVTNWAYNKYRQLNIWMIPFIYDISNNLLGFKMMDDSLGICKNNRASIVKTMEYFFKPDTLHISHINMPYLTYYSQWRFSNTLVQQLHKLVTILVNNPNSVRMATEIISKHKVTYVGVTMLGHSTNSGVSMGKSATNSDAAIASSDYYRRRQNSVPTNVGSSSSLVNSSSINDLVSSVDSTTIHIPHKKTLVIIDGMNVFYKPNVPNTHNINIKMLQNFLSDPGQQMLYYLLGQYIHERFGVIINEHEYDQFHIVMIFHERHKRVLDSCIQIDPLTGKKGAPKRTTISYVYTPDGINDDIVALYMWLGNPGAILITNDEHKNYLPNIASNNTYYRTLWAEWRRLFCITGYDYFSRYAKVSTS